MGDGDGARASVNDALGRVASSSYGRLVAFLAGRTRDLAAAEDALAEAFRVALEQWPTLGIPTNPEGWLLVAARRRLFDRARHNAVAAAAEDALTYLGSLAQSDPSDAELSRDVIPDERLALLFVCAHPAIDAGIRTPLMLQAVLGLDAARIASAFLVAPATMGQRLVRAKAKIKDAGIPFSMPLRREWPERVEAVLEAIYAAYGTSWDDLGADLRGADLAAEAIDLGRLVCMLLPDEAEAHAVVALMLLCESRRAARRTNGRYVPLDEQDIASWDGVAIAEAFVHIDLAARHANLGRFQLEALIQAMHARRLYGEPVNWQALADVYAGLVHICPTTGARVGRAAALGRAYGPEAGLAALDALDEREVADYQPYFATRATLLAAADRHDQAAVARARAIGLTEDPAVRAWLARQR